MTDRPTYVPTDPRELIAFVQAAPPILHTDEEHRQAMFEHFKSLAEIDPSYARWCCGSLARDNPTMHGDLLKRFDEWLESKGWGKPQTFASFMKGLISGTQSP